jgi:ATP-binding cassette subfamily C protein LapB
MPHPAIDRESLSAYPSKDFTPVLLAAVQACGLEVSEHFSWPDGPITSPAQLSTAARSLGLATEFLALKASSLTKPGAAGGTTAVIFLTNGAVLLQRDSALAAWPLQWLDEGYLGYLMTCVPAPLKNSGTPPDPRSRLGLEWFLGALAQHRMDFLWMLLASVFIQAAALTVPFMTMAVYDRVVPTGAMETLSAIAVGGLLMFGFDFIVRLLRGWFGDLAAKGVDHVLSGRLMEQTLRMEMSGRPASAGAFAARLRQYESVREFFTTATVTALVDLPMALLLTAVIFWLGGPVGWIPLLMAAIAITQVLVFQPWLRRLMQKAHELGIDRQAITGEIVNGLEVIKAANAEGVLGARVDQLEREAAEADLKLRRLTHFSSSFTLLCVNLTTIAVLVACVFLIGQRAMSMGGMIACMMISGRAMAPLAATSGVLLRLQQMLTSLKSLRELMSLPREDDRVPLSRPISFPSIRCDHLGFSYPGQQVPGLQIQRMQR